MPPSLKILVCYHKPAKLISDEIHQPIHVGRALAASQATQGAGLALEDYQWLLDNMIGDDTGDNISSSNRHYNELTAIYWAWKNYDQLGDPDYIGLSHYRRNFAPEDIACYESYDIIAPTDYYDDIVKQFKNSHFDGSLEQAFEEMLVQYPEMRTNFKKILSIQDFFVCNMFIMKKKIFFEYCEFLFSIVDPIHQRTDYSKLSFYNQRMPGFLTERLGSFFFYDKQAKGSRLRRCRFIQEEIALARPITPVYQDSINICCASDNNYAFCLHVLIASIKVNANEAHRYDICILDQGISASNQSKIASLATQHFSIRFIDISGFLDGIDQSIFHLNAHFTLATYLRFFIPEIFSDYKRVLYLDCDMVVHHDITELFHQNMHDKALAAVVDVEMQRCLYIDNYSGAGFRSYLTEGLQMKHPESYFQAGMLLLDVAKLKAMDFTNLCLQRLREVKTPRYVDQCILNSVFDGDIHYLDLCANVMWHIPHYVANYDAQLPIGTYLAYKHSLHHPKIIHYSGGVKPWTSPEVNLASIWWHYARTSSIYEESLSKICPPVEEIKAPRSELARLWGYHFNSILACLTTGRKREKHRARKRKFKKI